VRTTRSAGAHGSCHLVVGAKRILFRRVASLGIGDVTALPSRRESNESAGPPRSGSRSGQDRGFDVHAGVVVEAHDREGRERLLRYCTRPPLSLERCGRRGGPPPPAHPVPWRVRTPLLLAEVRRPRSSRMPIAGSADVRPDASAAERGAPCGIETGPRTDALLRAGPPLRPTRRGRSVARRAPRSPRAACRAPGASLASRTSCPCAASHPHDGARQGFIVQNPPGTHALRAFREHRPDRASLAPARSGHVAARVRATHACRSSGRLLATACSGLES
jgi:hypothetical protein